MNAVVTITESKEKKFIAVINIKNKFFLDGEGVLTSKPFVSKKVCIRNAEDTCQIFGLNCTFNIPEEKKGVSTKNGKTKK